MATALHCELVDAELLGTASGTAGQALRLARAPVIAPTPDDLDFLLGVETDAGTAAGKALRTGGGKTFELWREVADFAESGPTDPVYSLDRAAGIVQFGAGATGAIPPAGREIRAWYRRGGGRAGNVAAGTLTAIKDGPQGLEVTNPERAAGGSDAETIEGAGAARAGRYLLAAGRGDHARL